MINEDEDRLDRERRYIRNMGIILYLFIGGVIAAILANSMVEAVGFGAGWTGFIGVFGIKRDIDLTGKSVKKETLSLKESCEDANDRTRDAYFEGFADAIEKIAIAENRKVEDILALI